MNDILYQVLPYRTSTTLSRMRQAMVFSMILFGLVSSGDSRGQTQCQPSAYSLPCIESMAEELVYLKSYNIDGENGSVSSVEYTAVMGKNMHYVLYICTETGGADGIMLTISDPDRQVIAANSGPEDLNSMLEFPCPSTGIYYLTFTFRNSTHFCGSCILGVRKGN